jgi:hypothetical protein
MGLGCCPGLSTCTVTPVVATLKPRSTRRVSTATCEPMPKLGSLSSVFWEPPRARSRRRCVPNPGLPRVFDAGVPLCVAGQFPAGAGRIVAPNDLPEAAIEQWRAAGGTWCKLYADWFTVRCRSLNPPLPLPLPWPRQSGASTRLGVSPSPSPARRCRTKTHPSTRRRERRWARSEHGRITAPR